MRTFVSLYLTMILFASVSSEMLSEDFVDFPIVIFLAIGTTICFLQDFAEIRRNS
jgi:fumarate reductase subunit C